MFKKVYVSTFTNKYYNGCKELSINHYKICDLIRNYFSDKFIENKNPNEKFIYINRKIRINNSGNNRFIINNNELTEYLKNKKFESIEFEEMSLDDKFISTLNSTIIISPIGANLVNFFFSNNESVKLFILLVPKTNNGYFEFNLLQLKELGKIKQDIIKIVYCDVFINNISKDPNNNPYLVNIQEIDEILNEFFTPLDI